MIALIVAFWLMLPAYVPNNFAAIFGGGTPLDMGRVFQDGERTLGDGKTFRGTIAGTVCGVLMGLVQNQIAPFFGLPALTMTLVSRLAERTGAEVLFAWCERIGDGPDFALRIEAAPEGIADVDPQRAAAALNAGVEHIARRDPAQYQWTYKRYKARPSGSGDDNPYLDLERRR